VLVGGRRRRIAARGGTEQRPLLRLEGVEGRGAAAELVGEGIEVERGALGPLPEGEHLIADLIGLDVSDGATPIGRVRDVLLLPSVDCLEVERGEEGPLLVPLVEDAIRSIDQVGGTIDVDLQFVEGPERSGSDAD
jgi:16S rRNA processing protein RimM